MTNFKRMMTALRQQFGGVCAICDEADGGLDSLEFAHVLPTPIASVSRGRGGNNRAYDIKRNPHAYVLMCRPCHLRYDNFVREAKRLRTRVHGRWYLGAKTRQR